MYKGYEKTCGENDTCFMVISKIILKYIQMKLKLRNSCYDNDYYIIINCFAKFECSKIAVSRVYYIYKV